MSGLRPGTTVAGRYRIERSLGRGGMAEVFLARDLRLDRLVAVKVLAAGLSSDPSFVARFRREAQAAAGLSHPNIVAVYDWGEALGSYFIVMENAPGRTLAELIAAEAPVSAERTGRIGAQIAAALAVAHRNGVVHRDIKPANVIVDAEDAVKVTDFGIAHLAGDTGSRLTAIGTVLGTPAYISPEQAEGRTVDARTDLYSLGVVLYELATGTLPFRGESTPAVVYQHTSQPLEPPSLRNPAVPAALGAIITDALAKDPELRPASAEVLQRRLLALTEPREAATEATTVVAAGGPPSRAFAWGLRSRRAWALAALAAGALAVVGFVLADSLASHPGHPPARRGAGARVTSDTKSIPTTTAPTTTAPTTTAPTTTAPTTTAPTTTQAPTTFSGYQVVAGSGAGSLFCPAGITLGRSGQTPPAAPAHPGSGPDGSSGQGGSPGCGSNGGNGGKGGHGAPGAAGGAGGNGGAGGCRPATLTQMQQGVRPCDGTHSDGGNGGNGGKAAPGARGGNGGPGGPGGQTTNAKGGNGGNGGNAKPGLPGGNGGPGGQGGGPGATTSGVNGQNGAPGTNS